MQGQVEHILEERELQFRSVGSCMGAKLLLKWRSLLFIAEFKSLFDSMAASQPPLKCFHHCFWFGLFVFSLSLIISTVKKALKKPKSQIPGKT